MMKTQGRHFWVLFALLIAGGVFVNLWEWKGEARVERAPLKEIPASIGEWRQHGADGRFDAASEAVLRADDYVLRDYVSPEGRTAALYVGYYSTQRVGATYHSPLNCVPGSGWTMTEMATLRVTPADGSPAFDANAYMIQNASERSVLVYWYQGRGRAVASEYWDKLYTVWDSMRLRRSDGSMVRIIVPINTSEEQSLKTAADFAARVSPELPRFIPD